MFQKIIDEISQLQFNPTPPGCKKLQGGLEGFRIREGDYRILYTVNWKQRMVTVYQIMDRKEGYSRHN
jgi:mRNA interferase RelE/StbE